MQVSAEVRWFWREAPEGLAEWFRSADAHGCPAGGGETRTDLYLRDPGQMELGIKRRGGKVGVEVKGLVAAAWGDLGEGPFAGAMELWCKWSTEALEVDDARLIATRKRRWLRKFDTSAAEPREIRLGPDEKPADGDGTLPDRGCNVELTEVSFEHGEIWWTLGFESFGSADSVGDSLRAAAAVLASRRPPRLGGGRVASYPAWLAKHAPGGA